MFEKLKKLKKSKKKGNIKDLPVKDLSVKQDEPERKWKCVIIDGCKDSVDTTEGKDSAVVKSFDSPEELVEWAKNNMGLSIEITDFHFKNHQKGTRIIWR